MVCELLLFLLGEWRWDMRISGGKGMVLPWEPMICWQVEKARMIQGEVLMPSST
jgi:hypothetical protein